MSHTIISRKYERCVARPQEPSMAFFDRLRKFYDGQIESPKLSPIWEHMLTEFHGDLACHLAADNSSGLAAYMQNICNSPACYGIMAALEEGEWNGRLVDAACALGVVPVFCPTQPMPEQLDPEAVISAIETVLGCRLTHPGGGAMEGATVGDRFIPGKLLEAVYVAASIQRLGFPKDGFVFEFGSGAGMLIYLLAKMYPEADFQTADIPEISALHAYLLAVAFGEQTVWFYNEPGSMHHRFMIQGLELQPFFCDLAINQNSFPELNEEAQDLFLGAIDNNLVPGGSFYSWNHESNRGSQRRLFCAIQKFKNLVQIQRTPAWHRAGYVEEVWRKVC